MLGVQLTQDVISKKTSIRYKFKKNKKVFKLKNLVVIGVNEIAWPITRLSNIRRTTSYS